MSSRSRDAWVSRALMLAHERHGHHGIRRLTLASSIIVRTLVERLGFAGKGDEMVLGLRRKMATLEFEAA